MGPLPDFTGAIVTGVITIALIAFALGAGMFALVQWLIRHVDFSIGWVI